jgi:Tol biopolymer transport system component
MSLETGTRVGVYEVTGKLGEGGMGEVYLAHDTALGRDVALKVLSDAFVADPDRLARFQREAKVLASLNHLNIGGIYGLETLGNAQALVLELIDGPTLADRIKDGPIPIEDSLEIAKQIADALESAHEQGIVHRDLKPANIKVRPDGTVKVLDFGLAKAVSQSASGTSAAESPTVSLTGATQMGMVIGTAAYMSPEQAKGKPIDKRTDVWAFGAVLYEMLTGKKAFPGDDVSDTLATVLKSEPEWDELPSDTPRAILRLLHRCLAKDKKVRLREVGSAIVEIHDAEEEQPVDSRVSAAPEKSGVLFRPIVVLPAVIAVALLAGLSVWFMTQAVPEPVARFHIPLAAGQVFSAPFRPSVIISPDGLNVVYVANNSLWLRPIDQLEATEISGTDGASSPFFSFDGQSIGFWSSGQLRKVAVTGGAPVTIAEVRDDPDGPVWGSDNMIRYGHAGGIMQVSGASGVPETLVAIDEPEAAHGPQMLPDGESLLFTLRSEGPGTWNSSEVVVQSSVTGERVVLFTGRDARYLSTGHIVYSLDNVLFAVPFDLDTHAVLGGPVPLVENVAQVGSTGGAAQFSISADGTLILIPTTDVVEEVGGFRLVWLSSSGEQVLTAAPPRSYRRTRISPDGTRIAAQIVDQQTGNRDIWIWRIGQGPLTRLTFSSGFDGNPIWTPDGERVTFAANSDGTPGVYSKQSDGTGDVELLFEASPEEPVTPWAWTSDGRLVVTKSVNGQERLSGDIAVVDKDGTLQTLLDSDFSETQPALSPNERWLAYSSNESGRFEVYVQPFPNVDDGKWQISINGGGGPVWGPDGRSLYYRESVNRLMIADVSEGDSVSFGGIREYSESANVRLTTVQEIAGALGVRRPYDIHPDGDRMLVRVMGDGELDGNAFQGFVVTQNWFSDLRSRVPLP